jgi:hypothetical protein
MDDRSRQIETLRESRLMKAFAALIASNAVKRAVVRSRAAERRSHDLLRHSVGLWALSACP